MSTTTAGLQVSVVTPEETILEVSADFVALPLFDGEIGIQPMHSPMIGRLGYGELRLKNGSETSTYYVDGGFVQVADNQVAILTNSAMKLEELDADVAEKQLAEGLAMSGSGAAELAIRERVVSQARAQLRIASKAK